MLHTFSPCETLQWQINVCLHTHQHGLVIMSFWRHFTKFKAHIELSKLNMWNICLRQPMRSHHFHLVVSLEIFTLELRRASVHVYFCFSFHFASLVCVCWINIYFSLSVLIHHTANSFHAWLVRHTHQYDEPHFRIDKAASLQQQQQSNYRKLAGCMWMYMIQFNGIPRLPIPCLFGFSQKILRCVFQPL